MSGYIGKILNVNLSNGEFLEETIPASVYELLLSGVGLGAYILYNRIPAGADPMGPENILGFVSGLLTGTGSVVTGRWMVVCKSPLTGGWGDSNCGGTLSPAIKQCGYDGIFFSGISEKPVYLYIDHKGPQLKSAEHLWGMDAVESEEALTKEHWKRKKPAVAVIGQAAENRSLISGICNDGGRIAARSGGGAVMGSKRLKAVVLIGQKAIPCHEPVVMKTYSKAISAKVRKQNLPSFIPGSILGLGGALMGSMKKATPIDGILTTAIFKRWGTIMNNTMGVPNGDSPIKNWAGSVKDYGASAYQKLNPDRIIKQETQKYHCYSCIIGCGGIVDIRDQTKGIYEHTHKPEYETCCAFGGLILNKDLDAIYYINELLNRAGMDSISAGNTVAFAIEAYEKGMLTREMTGGLELSWGNAQSVIDLLKKMITREGIGDLLADGVKVASLKLGSGSEAFAIHAGGQEPGMHDARMDPLLGVHFSSDPTPGRHTIGSGQYYDMMHLWDKVSWAPNPGAYLKANEYIPSDEVALKTVANSCYKELTDGAGGCLFAMVLGVDHWPLFEWLNAATGWQKTPDEYMQTGKRIQTLRQMFNIKHGLDPMQSKMHKRMAGEPPLKKGPLKGITVPIEAMMKLHWKNFGWDENSGIPLPSTISELQLDQILEKVA
ncbi:MAG: aldehyde ferredoxin oxidoreductase [Chloroflexi bacterium HGW-Chloroflexi-10]|nr:MAG: aldehyde ferredoxin oxidoreductase [Chloroflexi bacterium HGW-Chloroflexi-10]